MGSGLGHSRPSGFGRVGHDDPSVVLNRYAGFPGAPPGLGRFFVVPFPLVAGCGQLGLLNPATTILFFIPGWVTPIGRARIGT